MVRNLVIILLGWLLLVGQSFAHKKKDAGEFPLTVHITAIDMQQGERGISGSGSTDSDGKYSSSVRGGGSYLFHLYTAHIDGDKREIVLTTNAAHYKGGRGLAMATMGMSAVATSRRNAQLHIGDYRGNWNKDGTLELQFINEKGELAHQAFNIQSEKLGAITEGELPAATAISAPVTNTIKTAPTTPVAVTPVVAQPITPVATTANDAPTPVLAPEPSLGDQARKATQHKACLELAKDNSSITCK
jgi:hypothetical protein